jgi:hypothetical protein
MLKRCTGHAHLQAGPHTRHRCFGLRPGLSSRTTEPDLQELPAPDVHRRARWLRRLHPPAEVHGVSSATPPTTKAEQGRRPTLDGERKDCPLDPYVIVHERCTFVDQQTIKLQEAPDAVPVGELPRHIQLCADRYLTGKVIPGSRVVATGIYSTFSSTKSGVRSCPRNGKFR